jgi:ribosomal protein L11 methylase PrmA
LIASGILVEQADEVAQALAAGGLTVAAPRVEGDWVVLIATR